MSSGVSLLPRQRDEPLEIRPGDRVLGGRRRHLREPVELAQGLPVRLLGHAGGLDLLAKLGQLLTPLVALAELLLDRLQLLPQVVLPLGLGHLALDLRVDLRPQLEDLGLLREGLHQRLEPRLDVGRLEERLALDGGQGGQGGGDEVDHPPRVAGAGDEGQEIVGQRRGQLDDPLEERESLPAERLGFHVVGRRHDVRHALDPGPEVRRRLRELHHAEPLEPLDDQADRAVGLLEHPVDHRDRARPVKLLGGGRLLRGVVLGQDADQPVAEDGLVHRAHGRRPRDRQRDDRLRKEHGLPERQDGQLVRLVAVGTHGVRRARTGRARLDSDVGVAHVRRLDSAPGVVRMVVLGHTVSSGIARPRAPPALGARLVALPYLLAPRAANREGMGPQPGRVDLLLARFAAPVASFLHLLQGQIDLREHAGPPVGHRKAHLVVGRQGGAVAERHALDLLAARRRLDATLALLAELGHEVGALLQEQRLQLRLHVGGALGRS